MYALRKKEWGAGSLGSSLTPSIHDSSCFQPARHPFLNLPIGPPLCGHRIRRLAGIPFGNPSVALSLVAPRRGHRARIYGRAYWHRATLARPLNRHPATEAEAGPLCALAA